MSAKPVIQPTATPVVVGASPAERLDLGALPLTAAERVQAENVAGRIRLELRGLLELVPEAERGASAMARALEIDRNTCQRIVTATARGEADAMTLVQLPGVQGLNQFVDAMSSRLSDPEERELLTSARAAIVALNELINALGGSQRKLRERLETEMRPTTADSPVPSDSLSSRRSLFRAAAEVTGRWSDVWISLTAIRPLPDNPLMTEVIKARGNIGHVAHPAAMPLEIGEHVAEHLQSDIGKRTFEPLTGVTVSNQDATQRYLLPDFCSQPLPKVTSRAVGTKIIHVIESASFDANSASGSVQPIDIVMGDKRARPDKHPATQHPALGEVWSMITFPARRLVFDVYLHKQIARRCIPSLEAHLWNANVGQQGLWRWSTRFPRGPKLELLGHGVANSGTAAYPRHTELTQHLFEQSGWDPEDFVGYRCDVPYPIWRAGYCMLFDFTGNELPNRTLADGAQPHE